MQVTGAHALQEYGACSASQQALQAYDQEELQKLVTMLPERLATTVLEQPDFSQVPCLLLYLHAQSCKPPSATQCCNVLLVLTPGLLLYDVLRFLELG